MPFFTFKNNLTESVENGFTNSPSRIAARINSPHSPGQATGS